MYKIDRIYDLYFDSVYNYVYYRLRHIEDTEDVVSTSFLKVARSIHTFNKQDHASIKSWLFAIVRNTLIDHYRRQQFRTHDEINDVEVAQVAQQTYNVDTQIAYEQTVQKIQRLSEQQQEIIVLRYQSGLRNKEIAELLNIKPKSVAAVLTKAQQALYKQLNNYNPYV